MSIKEYFLSVYLVIALIVGSLLIIDYTDCYKLKGNIRHAQAMGAGFTMIVGGLLWPATLPGMLALYGDREDHYCS